MGKKTSDSTNVTIKEQHKHTFNTGPEGGVRKEPVGEDISCDDRPL